VREPERQHPVVDRDGEVVAIADFGFPPKLFVVETDGLGTHKTPDQQQYDLNRQNRISDAGYDFRRFTYADVTQRPRYVCRETERGLLIARMVVPTPPILRRAA
jgi:very-short-patch-repair endonuclease